MGNDGSTDYSDAVTDNESINQSTIQLFPNPVKDVLPVNGLSANNKTTLTIVNAQGNVVKRVSVNAGNYDLNVSQFQRGTYQLLIESKEQRNTYQFIKE